jgi:hypothetical protein
VVNNSNQIVTVSSPINPGGTTSEMIRGDITVTVPGQGPIVFRDRGHDTPCNHPFWRVSIESPHVGAEFYYDGTGAVDLTIDEDGTVKTLWAGPFGQLIRPGVPPPCTPR